MHQDWNVQLVQQSALVLSGLAECEDNHTDILSGDFTSLIRTYIQSFDSLK
ncbi:MAG: hypothetical protein EZS28_038270, partial [Streblomastix strix]